MTLTNTLVVDTGLVLGTVVVTPAAGHTHEVITEFSTATVSVTATQGLARACSSVALFVTETCGTRRADSAAYCVLANAAALTVSAA